MQLRKPIKLIPLLFTIFAVVILSSLGVWQLYRLKEKNLLQASIKNNISSNPLIYSHIDKSSIYSKVKLKGIFLLGKDIHLYRRTASSGKDGYYLLSPFQLDEGKIIMVARGWFSSINKEALRISQIPQTQEKLPNKLQKNMIQEITGIVLQGEKTAIFMPNNDHKNNIWFTLDLQQMAELLELPLSDFYIFQLETHDFSELLQPLSPNILTKIKNDHLEYALTWFSLALCLIIIFIIYHRKE